MTVLSAGWGAPARVKAFTTVRTGGVGAAPYDTLNLGTHVGDDPEFVRQNRRLVTQSHGGVSEPLWLNQVHGFQVVRAEDLPPGTVPDADGAVTTLPGRPLVILTADCLPVVACDRAGTVVGAFHAGWRGLATGILNRGLAALGVPPSEILVWIGPGIGPDSYQVGPELRQTFLDLDPAHGADFRPDGQDKWKFDLAGAAVRRLTAAGVGSITRSTWDTYRDADLFFSHRRTSTESPGSACGRMGTFICLEKGESHE